jgi:hypothetical protein
MASTITTFSGLLNEILRLIAGDETVGSDLPVATLTRCLRAGEQRIYREVETRFNEATATLTATNNLAPMPADYNKPLMLYGSDGRPLSGKPEDWLRSYNIGYPNGDAEYFAQVGSSFTFGSPVSNGTTFTLRYYAELPALVDGTIASNALFQKCDSLFIYAALSCSAPYFEQNDKLPAWEGEYSRIRDELNKINDEKVYAAVGPSTVRYAGPIA